MSEYAFLISEDTGVSTTEIAVDFSTEYLDVLTEQFFWFLQRAGFTYVTSISVEKGSGDFVEFPTNV